MKEHYPDLFATKEFEDEVLVKCGRVVTSRDLQVFPNPLFYYFVICSPKG